LSRSGTSDRVRTSETGEIEPCLPKGLQ